MGGYMQPPGHVQVLTNLLAFSMHAQAARDAPQQAVEPLPFLISRQENMYDSNHEKLLFPVTS